MRKVAAAFLATLSLNTACAAAKSPVVSETRAEAASGVAGLADEADMVAQEAVAARVTMLLHLDRLRGFRFSRRLMLLGGWADALQGTGIDPLRDVRRAFVAARASHSGQVAVVLQHSAPEDRVARSLEALHRKWQSKQPKGGARQASSQLDAGAETLFPDPSQLPFPAAYRSVPVDYSHAEGPVLVAAPRPGILAILPPERVLAAFRLADVGGLPAPRGGEAIVIRAWDPRSSVENGPAWSADVRYVDVVLAFDRSGNTALSFRALCTSREAARRQADLLTTQVDEAQSVALGGARLRLFDFIRFHAEDDRVRMRTQLHADDVDWIVAMTMEPM